MTPLHEVVPLIVGIHDICAVAAGQGPQALARRSGYLGGDLRFDCDGSGIEVEQSRYGPATITWPQVHAVIQAGLTDELAHKARARWTLYGTVASERVVTWRPLERPDSVARARADAHRVRYDRAVAAMRAVTAEVIDRGLATTHVQQSLFPPAMSPDQQKALDCLSRVATTDPAPGGHALIHEEIR